MPVTPLVLSAHPGDAPLLHLATWHDQESQRVPTCCPALCCQSGILLQRPVFRVSLLLCLSLKAMLSHPAVLGCKVLLVLLEPTVTARTVAHSVQKAKRWRLFYHRVNPEWSKTYLGYLSLPCRWLPWDTMPTESHQVRYGT